MNKFIGTYHLNIQPKIDHIDIRGDGTYTHKFIFSEKIQIESAGKWEYDSTTNEITLKNFSDLNGSPTGNWYSKIEISTEGKIHLVYSSENNIFYEHE